MAKNNEFQERLHDEIVEALEGLKENSEKYIDKLLNNIPLLEATIKEVLRLYPPISVIFRRSTTDNYDLGGYIIPKGTNVEMSSYAIHRYEHISEMAIVADNDKIFFTVKETLKTTPTLMLLIPNVFCPKTPTFLNRTPTCHSERGQKTVSVN